APHLDGSAFPHKHERKSNGGCRGSSKKNVKQHHVVDRRLRSKIKTNRGCNQNKQCQSRYDEHSQIGKEPIARRRKIGISKRGRFHAEARSPCSVRGSEPDLYCRTLSTCPCEIRQQIAEMLTPKDSMI